MNQLTIPAIAVLLLVVSAYMTNCERNPAMKNERIPDLLLPHEDSPIVDGVRTVYLRP